MPLPSPFALEGEGPGVRVRSSGGRRRTFNRQPRANGSRSRVPSSIQRIAIVLNHSARHCLAAERALCRPSFPRRACPQRRRGRESSEHTVIVMIAVAARSLDARLRGHDGGAALGADFARADGICAGRATAASSADHPSQRERECEQHPQHTGVEQRVDCEPGPDGQAGNPCNSSAGSIEIKENAGRLFLKERRCACFNIHAINAIPVPAPQCRLRPTNDDRGGFKVPISRAKRANSEDVAPPCLISAQSIPCKAFVFPRM